MTQTVVSFTVVGTPIPQGSKTAFMAGARPVVVEQGRAKLKPWRAQIADAAAAAMNGGGLVQGAVEVEVAFFFPRPKSHYRANGEVKPSAPALVSVRPDIDKVARAVLDAITGVVIRDDAQVARMQLVKWYDERPRVDVTVSAL